MGSANYFGKHVFFLKQPNMQASKLLIEEIVQTYLWTALNIF